MKINLLGMSPKVLTWLVSGILIVVLLATGRFWMPGANGLVENSLKYFRGGTTEDEKEADEGDSTSIELSAQAKRNIGLTDDKLGRVKLTTFRRAISVPAMVVERPGRTQIQVATPMTGVITHVHAVTGESVEPGTLLFQIRLTHEDLVKAQTEFLKTVGELAVERREVVRLTAAARTGAVAPILLIEREYAVEKLESLMSAQKEALRLHGLSERQVDQIAVDRRLLRELQIVAPIPDRHSEDELRLTIRNIAYNEADENQTGPNPTGPNPTGPNPTGPNQTGPDQTGPDQPQPEVAEETVPLVLSELNVHKGQAVDAGTTLCVLSDMRKLYIEGLAFEQDAAILEQSASKGWPISAVTQTIGSKSETLEGLPLVYIDNQVSYESRALKFYVDLPNVILRTSESDEHQRFIDWRFKPGQRMQLRILVEEWPDRIVLPVNAVAQDGAEYFVFRQNGSHFDRRSVHVEHKDQFDAVVANDGSLFPGDIVAMTGAFEMQMALKKRSAPAVHHGHSH